MIKSLNAKDTLKLINLTYLTTKDIQKLGCLGEKSALKIKELALQDMKNKNAFAPKNMVLTEYVIKHLGIDESRIRSIATGGTINE